MDLATFNALPDAEAAAVVRPCADIPAWVDDVVSGRPYPTRDALVRHAADSAAHWSEPDLTAALAHHPRIGERARGDTREAAMSRQEQGACSSADDATAAAIADGNIAYERRFGRIFLIRAAGRTAPEILENLIARLRNDDATETLVAIDELRQIALLRLEGLIDEETPA
ncbi:2-oxo-4-hydroxy-4-carboxy-5-ureidoimidazoline decarboxylase [Myceligenerans pegani]|uniref:2-oxo-4-hydroxy-4-carboxy-5-ureidoimidazoline decarboxylase n=1 Tax=Myceligenerans pegani TaxID=2776917 RepID=A0ABR9N2C5_9MICO|nr:2-oxo-4-hydroxy-4-carboxy-5-ureidoimidazoline decarboxylase [Myceligenerans sp. TRM 65318]MBE1877800.1 2-oxo-4-hydroxy-4-carboxy-5-ureidoimidazoline decarboxylase [Myceligenerans sp. TRM 65318]MBE3020071.1 2-oxo-4-hydroxy-4-carboxy-5-ureidoimidazoline decarboxylase [Myceligenerans sp. TRM 65318]